MPPDFIMRNCPLCSSSIGTCSWNTVGKFMSVLENHISRFRDSGSPGGQYSALQSIVQSNDSKKNTK
ncbi:hypothetical protein PILCRDRAFT_825087 [Piloderma croceum F 1598]|uniref:Uncharacterized protein n=1 Tax=Piloderma croceum (strain F 1598) TaxID=765440 RepID=A0A0C3FDC8_PILCF|nr:hypothetical protein PILCRDRAFT_825087 [Piloderma croceum F 1598]